MAKSFIWINETSERINEFAIGYMINPTLHVNKSFKERVEKYMNNKFGLLTQPFIKKNPKKEYKCFIIINVLRDKKK